MQPNLELIKRAQEEVKEVKVTDDRGGIFEGPVLDCNERFLTLQMLGWFRWRGSVGEIKEIPGIVFGMMIPWREILKLEMME